MNVSRQKTMSIYASLEDSAGRVLNPFHSASPTSLVGTLGGVRCAGLLAMLSQGPELDQTRANALAHALDERGEGISQQHVGHPRLTAPGSGVAYFSSAEVA